MERRRVQIRTDQQLNDRMTSSRSKAAGAGRGGLKLRRKAPSNPIEESIGVVLRQLRLARGLNQTELGRRLGVSLQQVQKYESGADRMAASTVFRAAETLGVEVAAFYAGVNKPKSGAPRLSKMAPIPFLVVPLTVSARAAPAREAELIDVIRHYQAITSAPDRALVRKLLKRLSAASQRIRTASQ